MRLSFRIVALSAVGLVFGVALAEQRGVVVVLRESESPSARVIGKVELYRASHALVVGINAYQAGWPRLSNAVKDAQMVAGALRSQGFDVTERFDLDSAALEKAFKDFFVITGQDPESRLFVWFAGHGHTEGGEGYLVPTDAPLPSQAAGFRLKALSVRRFGEYAREARSKHVLAVFDSCFAGTVFQTARGAPPAAITRATTNPARQFITSGEADQKVSDNGTFRQLFVGALSGEEAKADANGDGYVTGEEMGLFLTNRLTNLTENRQTPRYGKLADAAWDKGDFVFLVARPAPPGPTTKPTLPPTPGPPPPVDTRALVQEAVRLYTGVATGRIDEKAARERLERAAQASDPLARMWIARSIERGRMGYARDLTRAREMAAAVMPEVERRASGGDVEALFLLGSALRSGLAVGKDPGRAMESYRKACEGGSLLGCNKLGGMYEHGKDPARAVELYRKACDGREMSSCSELGAMYANGTGVAKDLGRAVTLLSKACEGGPASGGCSGLGTMYNKGWGVTKDPGRAVELFRSACEGGDIRGCLKLGVMYRDGSGVPKEPARAVELYRKACDGGDMLGCVVLGETYEDGMGVTKNLARAVELYRKACDEGEMWGCYDLAKMYDAGREVPRDTAEAMRLRRQACDGGVSEACEPQTLASSEEQEPNDGVSQANWIEVGKTYGGTVRRERDPNDYFAFSTTGVDASYVRVLVRAVRCDGVKATLIDLETEEEILTQGAYAQNLSKPFPVRPDRKYLLRLSPHDMANYCAYELRLTPEGD